MVPMLPDRAAEYKPREPLWGQRWSWRRDYLKAAATRNTLPALALRALAVLAFQAAFVASAVLYGLAIGLALVGAY